MHKHPFSVICLVVFLFRSAVRLDRPVQPIPSIREKPFASWSAPRRVDSTIAGPVCCEIHGKVYPVNRRSSLRTCRELDR